MRLTESQLCGYTSMSPEFEARAKCTAGVRLCMITDARQLTFQYEILSWCRSTNVVDLLENGNLTASVRLADMQSHGAVTLTRCTSGESRVDILLPNTCGIRITDADFGDCRPAPSPKHRLLLLGDSILQGIATYHPYNTLSNQMLLGEDTEGINQSVGGAYFLPERLEKLDYTPDRILVAMGANDAWNPRETYREHIPAWFDKLHEIYPDIPAYVVTPVWGTKHDTDQEYREKVYEVSDLIRRSAAVTNAKVIDGLKLVPHHKDFFNEDGCHPNDLGYSHYALNLERFLR